MESSWIWWLIAVLLVIAEMFSGTFYLLAVALGMAAAGLAAYIGAAWVMQSVTAALLCSISVFMIYRWRQRQGKPKHQANLAYDIGQSVHVAKWVDERHARVNYRGAEWDAELSGTATCDQSKLVWRIKAMVGSQLIIE